MLSRLCTLLFLTTGLAACSPPSVVTGGSGAPSFEADVPITGIMRYRLQ